MLSLKSVKHVLSLGLTIVLPKIPLLLAPYFLTKENYTFFNNYFYTSSLIILWASLGFGFSISFTKTKYRIIITSILINICIVSAIVIPFFSVKFTPSFLVLLIIYSFFTSAANVFAYRLLYLGKIGLYLMVNIAAMLVLLLSIILGTFFPNIGIGFAFGSVFYFVLVFYFIITFENEKFDGAGYTNLYSVGFSSFIINSIVPLILIADKIIVNNNLDSITANSYTFAWSLSAPIFYIGNVFEKIIYSGDKENYKKNVQMNFILNSIFILLYFILIYTVVNVYDSILPNSVSKGIVQDASLLMLIGYSIYSIIHFPLNGYLFKYKGKEVSNRISVYYVASAFLFIGLYFVLKDELIIGYQRILYFNFAFLALLLAVKIAGVFVKLEKNKVEY